MKIRTIPLALVFAAAAFAQADRSRFEYDREAALEVQVAKVEPRGHAEVRDISYTSPIQGRVPAYLVVPKAAGRHPAIVYAHWMMAGAPNANRTEFLDEALELARHGVVSLLIESPMNRKDKREFPPDQPGTASLFYSRQMVVDIRRGLDLLTRMEEVDPTRIAVVGHSFGATATAIVSGVDPRPKAYVIMAVALDQEHFLRHSQAPAIVKLRSEVPAADFEEYLRMAAPQDAKHYISQAAPAAVLLQYAEDDEFATPEDAQRSLAIASEPKELKMYPGGHELTPEARKDRVAWLRKQLAK